MPSSYYPSGQLQSAGFNLLALQTMQFYDDSVQERHLFAHSKIKIN